jgi:hypothetical protein
LPPLGIAAGLVAIGALVLILMMTGSPSPNATSAGSSPRSHPIGGTSHGSHRSPLVAPSATPSTAASTPSTTSAPATTTTSVPIPPSGDSPVIVSLDPPAGAAGQRIVVAGRNFMSASGEIVAAFDGVTTSTSCPTQSACAVTVPPASGPSATVTITTSAGTSNALTFSYDGGASVAPPPPTTTAPTTVSVPPPARRGAASPPSGKN